MSMCMGMECSHKCEKSGKCTFAGTCIVSKYNLNQMDDQPAVVRAEPVVAAKAEEPQVVFNPFQRGNGCLLAGYTEREIYSHTR